MSRNWLAAFGLAALLYVGGYLMFRQLNTEVWNRDQKTYVVFPIGTGELLYYVWRPLTLLDGALTGRQFHVGPLGGRKGRKTAERSRSGDVAVFVR